MKKFEDIHDAFEAAAQFHGHSCPGLAIGVRAAWEAQLALPWPIQESKDSILCLAESAACWMDGIQFLLGATWGNGHLKLWDTGRDAFNFYHPEREESLRLALLPLPRELPRPELAGYILTAPVEKVFKKGPAACPWPERRDRGESRLCPHCSEMSRESLMMEIDGELLCPACAGKLP